MNIRQLRHFLAVADTRHFKRAADLSGLSQQAISKSILQLESAIGLKLFDRDRQSVRLTADGELMVPYARNAVAEFQRLDDMVGDLTGRTFGQLKIGAAPALAVNILPKALERYCALHPNVRVVVERGGFTKLRDQMLQGELDVILATAPDTPQSHLVSIATLSTDSNIVVVRPGHPLLDEKPADCDRLKCFPRIGLRHFPKAEAYLTNLFDTAGQTPPMPMLSVMEWTLALTLVERGDYWCATPRQLAARHLEDGMLVELAVPATDPGWPLVIATRRHVALPPAVAAFVDLVSVLFDS